MLRRTRPGAADDGIELTDISLRFVANAGTREADCVTFTQQESLAGVLVGVESFYQSWLHQLNSSALSFEEAFECCDGLELSSQVKDELSKLASKRSDGYAPLGELMQLVNKLSLGISLGSKALGRALSCLHMPSLKLSLKPTLSKQDERQAIPSFKEQPSFEMPLAFREASSAVVASKKLVTAPVTKPRRRSKSPSRSSANCQIKYTRPVVFNLHEVQKRVDWPCSFASSSPQWLKRLPFFIAASTSV